MTFSFLKNHPFAVEAFFESSLVLTFAVPQEQLKSLIPECLDLDTFNDQFAFIAVAMVQTRNLRPKGFPTFLGNDFFLAGYRIFVRYVTSKGKRLRGLYILKSQTDKKKMEFVGNLFTHYNYTTVNFMQHRTENSIAIKSKQSAFDVLVQTREGIDLPVNSPFTSWKEARRFAGPLPFTFTYSAKSSEVLIIEGVRQNWKPEPVHVVSYHIPFLKELNLNGIQLANAFVIYNIPYYWKKGVIDKWKH